MSWAMQPNPCMDFDSMSGLVSLFPQAPVERHRLREKPRIWKVYGPCMDWKKNLKRC